MDHYDSKRASSLDRRPRREEPRVQFDRPRAEGTSHPQRNRDTSYNRGRDNSYSRSRDQSPSDNREHSDSHDNGRFYSRPRDSRYNRFREPRYNNNRFRGSRQSNNYNPRFASRPFLPRQEYGGQRNNYNNGPREWPTVRNNSAYIERTDFSNNQRLGQRDIVCHKCNKRGHIARECWTDMARINRQYRRN